MCFEYFPTAALCEIDSLYSYKFIFYAYDKNINSGISHLFLEYFLLISETR